MKKYRVFYHYNKQEKKMSVHFRGKCHIVNDVNCSVEVNTKWNKRQPYLVMQGFARDVMIVRVDLKDPNRTKAMIL